MRTFMWPVCALAACSGPKLAEKPNLQGMSSAPMVGGRLAASPWAGNANELLAEVERVISSYRFEHLVLARDDLQVSVGGQAISGQALLDRYDRERAPSELRIANDEFGDGTPGITAPCRTGTMMVRIKPYVLRQWASNSLVDRACAVNTVAHELTHTVLEDNKQVFTDDKSRWKFWHWGASSPLVSYTVGSYAQCAYLEAHGVIAAGTLATCVEMNGTHTFRGCEHLDDASDGLAQLREPACE